MSRRASANFTRVALAAETCSQQRGNRSTKRANLGTTALTGASRQQSTDAFFEQRFRIGTDKRHRRFIAPLGVRISQRNVTHAAVAVAGNANEVVAPLRLGEQLVIDERLAGQV